MNSSIIELAAQDGHRFKAYKAMPAGKPKGDGGERKSGKEKDWRPELGLKSPAKEKGKQTDASPLDPGIDLHKD